jgi:hypothetical protein
MLRIVETSSEEAALLTPKLFCEVRFAFTASLYGVQRFRFVAVHCFHFKSLLLVVVGKSIVIFSIASIFATLRSTWNWNAMYISELSFYAWFAFFDPIFALRCFQCRILVLAFVAKSVVSFNIASISASLRSKGQAIFGSDLSFVEWFAFSRSNLALRFFALAKVLC